MHRNTMFFLIPFCFYISIQAQAPLYPTEAGIVDVTKAPYFADNSGALDVSLIVNQALEDFNDSHAIIYFPEGTYRVSNRIEWGNPPGCESGSTFTCHRYTIIAGAGESKSILKLDDNHPDYQDPINPKFMVITFASAAMSFENGVRNLTINVGSGNPGVNALGFEANNQGGIQNVTIKSEDGQGQIGLHMGIGDQAGPCLIRDLTVEGFDRGVYTFGNQNSIYFERLNLFNQNEYGFYNRQQSISIKDLYSESASPVIYNQSDGGSIITMINSIMIGQGDASNQIAFINNNLNPIFLRNVNVSGYNLALNQIRNGFSLEQLENGLIEEYTTRDPLRVCDNLQLSLNLPIKDTPPIVYEDTSNWVSITEFGAAIDNGFAGQGSSQDDTQAIINTFNSGASTILVPGPRAPFPQRFIAYDTIVIPATVKHIIGAKGLISGNVTFEIAPGNDTLIIEDFAQFQSINHFSGRTLILKNVSIREYSSLPNGGSGDVFIEDLVGGPWEFNFQNVWARQFNTEKDSINIINNGGNLWILGMKTEKKGTAIYSKNSAKTEVLGSLYYGNIPDEVIPKPIFVVEESSFSIAGFKELNYIDDTWDIKLREIRNGITNDFEIGNSVIQTDLFVAYVSTASNKAPFVDAGQDLKLVLPNQNIQLEANFNDDGLPNGNCFIDIIWNQIKGPSTMQIQNPDTKDPMLNFVESGSYAFEIKVTDGSLETKDTVNVFVFDQFTTTLDHDQDSLASGNGADANLRGWSNFLKNYGGTDSFGPRYYNQFPAKSIVRLDISAFDDNTFENVMLEFELATTNTGLIDDWEYNIFGLNDGDDGEDWVEGNLNGTESPNNEVNYDNAPGFSTSFGGEYDENITGSGGVDHSRVKYLGLIKTRKNIREKVYLNSDELRDFLNEDTNGEVTFLITRKTFALNTIVFASKEHASFAPPTLFFDFCSSNTMKYLDESSTGNFYGDNWINAYKTLDQLKNDPCFSNIDSLKIAEGTYKPNSIVRNDYLILNNNITLEGGFEKGGLSKNPILFPTYLSGEIGDENTSSDNLYHVVKIEAGNHDVHLIDLVIKDGNANGTGLDQFGGGVFCEGQLTLKDVVIEQNLAAGQGEAMYLSNDATVNIVNSTVIK